MRVLVPAGTLAAAPGSVHQSNRNTQVVYVDDRGAQSAGLMAGQTVIPVDVGAGLDLNDLLLDTL